MQSKSTPNINPHGTAKATPLSTPNVTQEVLQVEKQPRARTAPFIVRFLSICFVNRFINYPTATTKFGLCSANIEALIVALIATLGLELIGRPLHASFPAGNPFVMYCESQQITGLIPVLGIWNFLVWLKVAKVKLFGAVCVSIFTGLIHKIFPNFLFYSFYYGTLSYPFYMWFEALIDHAFLTLDKIWLGIDKLLTPLCYSIPRDDILHSSYFDYILNR